jgi:hypothetical protein
MMRRILFAAMTAALAAGAAQAAPAIGAGVYDNSLIIGVDPATGAVSGYFDMTQGGQPSFSCIFYLKGRLAGRAAIVDTFFPDDPKGDLIRGSLSAQGPDQVRLALPSEHGGCANVWQFADKTQPADFVLLGNARPWIAVRVVKADKAYFSLSPGAAHGKAYIVKGDGVGVRAAQAGWAQVDFFNGTRTSSGWLRDADLYAP